MLEPSINVDIMHLFTRQWKDFLVIKGKSQNSRGNHKTQGEITKLEGESQNSRENHKAQGGS